MYKTRVSILICTFAAVCCIFGCSVRKEDGAYTRNEAVMGTFLQIKIDDPEITPKEAVELLDGAVHLAKELEKKFSVFDLESELNMLNINKSMKVSPELFKIIASAKKISRLTGGEFDVTVAPVMKADGFYSDMPEELLEKIPNGTGGVGWRNVTLKPDGTTVVLRKGAWLDLSGIAKGYIVDRISSFLYGQGVKGVLVNAGGDMLCRSRTDGRPWRIGVRDPSGMRVLLVLSISDKAVATSGDYENVLLDKSTGKMISHIIDPSSGEAIADDHSSVTVIAPKCSQADALATAMMAMGPTKAIALADVMHQVSVITVHHPWGEPVISYSRGAEDYFSREKH